MSSEKPFWEGKTCSEMAGLHVKVTFNSGTVVTGVTDINGDIDEVDILSPGDGSDGFLPCNYVKSIELVDDPEYERIDNIEDVRVGDVFVANDGNKYLIDSVDINRAFERCKVYLSYAPDFWLSDIAFAYALRLKSRLPDKPGLWLDNEDCVWLYGEDNRLVRLDGSEGWQTCYGGMEFSNPMLRSCAPFRPAEAVEA